MSDYREKRRLFGRTFCFLRAIAEIAMKGLPLLSPSLNWHYVIIGHFVLPKLILKTGILSVRNKNNKMGIGKSSQDKGINRYVVEFNYKEIQFSMAISLRPTILGEKTVFYPVRPFSKATACNFK
jgi:hypothetical protein